jgi:uncharacterized cupredoxin-like copper-binding protein
MPSVRRAALAVDLPGMRPGNRLWLACAAAFAAALVMVSGTAASKPAGRQVSVVERDFRIKAPAVVKAGDVRLDIRNAGPDTHELIVIRAGRGPLPLRMDGLTVDEDALRSRTVGGIEPAKPGSSRSTDLHLAPGRYVLFCNMAGHYLGGMHTTLVVR